MSGSGKTGIRPWRMVGFAALQRYFLPSLAALLLAAGCAPTEGEDGSFVPIPTTNADFNSPQFIPVGNQPITMAVGNFDGAGGTDIAVVNFLELNAATLPLEQKVSGSLSILLNDGLSPPGFTETVIDLGKIAGIIIAGNLNGAGNDDIAILVDDPDNPHVWICTDAPACATPATVTLPGVAAFMARANLDGNATADLVLTISSTLEVVSILDLAGPTVSTTVTNIPGRFAVGNFDGAGFDDLAVLEAGANEIEILTGNGDGTFTLFATRLTVVDNPFTLIRADLDGANNDDLAVTSDINDRVTVFTSTGASTFSKVEYSVGEDPSWLLAGDFTGASSKDLFVVHDKERFITFMNGDGITPSFAIGQKAVTRDPFDMEPLDVSGDGNLDLVVVERDKRAVSVLAGNGAGNFTRTQIGFSATVTFPIAADIDTGVASPRIDLLLLQPFSDRVVLLSNVNP